MATLNETGGAETDGAETDGAKSDRAKSGKVKSGQGRAGRAAAPKSAPDSAPKSGSKSGSKSGPRKQPDVVRRRLIEGAEALIVTRGLADLTLAAVAAAAGVTKGGLLHHFPSKQALVRALFADCLARLDAVIDAALARDGAAHGRFTRAYLDSVVEADARTRDVWAALSIALLSDPALRADWSDWVRARHARHRATDDDPRLAAVRHAADGLWLADLLHEEGGAAERAAVVAALRALTRAKDDDDKETRA